MPRPNPPRSINAERTLAARIAYERDARRWTNEGLARRMTDAGCPIQASAIYKIERSDPPRRITVNELVGFARVFGTTPQKLLDPVDEVLQGKAKQFFVRWQKAMLDNDRAHTRLREAEDAIAQIVQGAPGMASMIEEAFRAWASSSYDRSEDQEQVVRLMMDALRRRHPPQPADRDAVGRYLAEVTEQ